MARCAKFPPPWYVLNGVSGEDLLQLIKVKKDKATDEKRRAKKKKGGGGGAKQKCGHKHNRTKKWGDTSVRQVNRENVNQLFDKSSLTEELEQPASDTLNDSSHNTQKIKGEEHGSIIQVDLRLKRV